jgi:hypothetical protein
MTVDSTPTVRAADLPVGWCGGELRWGDDEVDGALAAGATVLRYGYGEGR